MCAPVCVYGVGRGRGRGCAWSDIPLCVVDRIPKTRCVHNGEPQLHTLLFYVHCMFSDLHCLHDPLWRRGKLRPGQGQGPAQSGHTTHPSQCCPDCLTHTAPLPAPGGCLGACSLGTSKEHISQHRKCRWLLALAPASSLLPALFSDSWNPLGVRDSLQEQDSGPCPASAPKSLGSWLVGCQAK